MTMTSVDHTALTVPHWSLPKCRRAAFLHAVIREELVEEGRVGVLRLFSCQAEAPPGSVFRNTGQMGMLGH